MVDTLADGLGTMTICRYSFFLPSRQNLWWLVAIASKVLVFNPICSDDPVQSPFQITLCLLTWEAKGSPGSDNAREILQHGLSPSRES